MKTNRVSFLLLLAISTTQNTAMQNDTDKEWELLTAVRNNNVEKVTQLLKEVINPNALSNALDTATSYHYISNEIVKQLLQHNAPTNQKNYWGQTPLLNAVKNKGIFGKECDKIAIQLLLDCKADVHAQGVKGETAIIYASKYSNSEFIPLLLQKGSLLNQKDNSFYTALAYAVEEVRLEVLEKILSNTFQRPDLYYEQNNSKHVLELAKENYLNQVPVYNDVEKARKCQKIGKALIIFEGFYTGRSGIAKKGFAQTLPIDIAKYMAAHYDYKSILFPENSKV